MLECPRTPAKQRLRKSKVLCKLGVNFNDTINQEIESQNSTQNLQPLCRLKILSFLLFSLKVEIHFAQPVSETGSIARGNVRT